jgi:hypothetical protein
MEMNSQFKPHTIGHYRFVSPKSLGQLNEGGLHHHGFEVVLDQKGLFSLMIKTWEAALNA